MWSQHQQQEAILDALGGFFGGGTRPGASNVKLERHGRYRRMCLSECAGHDPVNDDHHGTDAFMSNARSTAVEVWYRGRWAVVIHRRDDGELRVYPDLSTANHQLCLASSGAASVEPTS